MKLWVLAPPSALAGVIAACGSLADPAQVVQLDAGPAVATVSGALVSSPANARVALVWRVADGQLVAAADVAVDSSGSFAIGLPAPPDTYLVNVDPEDFAEQVGGTDFDWPYGYAKTAGSTDLMTAAAGFVVYEDTNANGQLDLDPSTRVSTDTLIGGADDLQVTYFKGGTALDYEKMRSGLLPHEGYNLEWTIPDVWVGLDTVKLKTDRDLMLPGTLCGDVTAFFAASLDAGALTRYPPMGLNVDCNDDGLTFWATASPTWNPETCASIPRTVCSKSGEGVCVTSGITSGSWVAEHAAGEPLPAAWPCTFTPPDAGP